MKINFIRYGLAVLLMLILVAFTQCISQKTVFIEDRTDVNAINIPTDALLPQDVNAPDVGVKDFERIFITMSALTGVPSTNATIRNNYNNFYRTQLPTNARLESYQESQMLSTLKLGTEFCNVLLNNGTLRAAIWPAAQFNFGSGTLFNNAQTKDQFIIRLMNNFWGEGVLDSMEYEEGGVMLDGLMLEAMAAGSNTLNTAKIACSAALSSAHVVIE